VLVHLKIKLLKRVEAFRAGRISAEKNSASDREDSSESLGVEMR
jgi:hypothetical protein